MTFSIPDFDITDSAADKLAKTDQLVELGISRERAERIITRLYKILDGPWTDILNSTKRRSPDDLETAFLQTCLVAYMSQWADERLTISGVTQSLCLSHFLALDADSKEAN